MAVSARPPAEVSFDADLVRLLLHEQHPDLACLELIEVSEGWDNRIFRLGEELAVRMPRRAVAAALIEQEQRWLPQLSARLPVPVPAPVRIGRPGCGFPWSWSVVPWLPGQSALLAPLEPMMGAAALGQFLQLLHRPAPEDAPHNPWRGVPLVNRDQALRKHLQQLDGVVNADAVLRLWDRALCTPSWSGPPLWIHGDLHPGNLLVVGGCLSAVVDFGDLAAGDPATDISVMWMLLPPAAWPALLSAARSTVSPLDPHTRMRARGWALALGLAWLANSRDDETMRSIGRTTVDAALNHSA